MKIHRKTHNYLKSLINKNSPPHDVILLGGARQVGKSTLIKDVLDDYKNVCQVNLEEDVILAKKIDQTSSFDEFEYLIKTTLGFNPLLNQILFIDEAQESKKLGSYVRFIKEKWEKTKCILTGSSMKNLFQDRAPVGRVQSLTLGPLSFYEFLCGNKRDGLVPIIDDFIKNRHVSDFFHKEFLENFDRYLQIGGLPEVVTTHLKSGDYRLKRAGLLKLQEDDFLRKEIFKKQYLFRDCLRGVANHLGSPSSLVHISENSYNAKEIISLMTKWNLIHEVEQHGFASTTHYHPKRYVYDVGIAQDIRNMPFPRLSVLETRDPALRTQLGGIFENAVLISLKEHKMGQVDISGWKKSPHDSAEVDFVLRTEKTIPIECKASLKVTPRAFANIRQYLKLAGVATGFLISLAPFEIFKDMDFQLINLPVYLCRVDIIEALANEYY
ncbi:MAG: ATP-binding protein [Deltaproteobacteria bacterium]|nr:ATP-binding protein [Deltaproteobacteria bacterium]